MSEDKNHVPAADNRQARFALTELIAATRILAATLTGAARRLHRDQGLSVPERALLLELRQNGPQTVPALARRREVSRQFIQVTANPLLVRGVLECQANPAHRRSKLVALTEKGIELAGQVMQREGTLMHEVATGMSAEEIRQATGTLERLQGLMKKHTG